MKEFKVVVLGPGGVGKSALTVQFISGKFVERYDPTVEDFYRKEIEVDGDPAILEILDTAGTEQFASMRDLYIKNGQGFIIVYSLTSKQSFQDIKLIREQILRVKGTNRVPMVLAGNKYDLAASTLLEVSTEEGIDLANEWSIPYIQTSAKSSLIVNSLFTEIVKEMNFKSFNSNYGIYNRNKDNKKRTRKQKDSKNICSAKIISQNTNTTLFSNNSESYASSLKDSVVNSSKFCLKKRVNESKTRWSCFRCCYEQQNVYVNSKCENSGSNKNILAHFDEKNNIEKCVIL